jgi:hypothetical protein
VRRRRAGDRPGAAARARAAQLALPPMAIAASP